METMTRVTPEEIQKRFKKAKDHQPVEIAYMAPLPASKAFKVFLEEHGYGGQYMVKISRTHTITNCKYGELEYVKADNEARAAAIEAGEAEAKRERPARNKIIPNILEEKDGIYYFLTYPREGSKTDPGKAYCIMNEDGSIFAEYDSIEPLREFIQPAYFKAGVNKETGEYTPSPIRQWRVDRMYEVWPE